MKKHIIASALLLGLIAPAARAANDDAPATTPPPRVTISLPVAAPEKRPAILPVLYVGLAGLQAFDIYSTDAAVARGAVEANPVMSPIAGDTAAMIVRPLAASRTGTNYAFPTSYRINSVSARR